MKILFSPAHYIYDEFKHGSEQYTAFSIADRIASMNPGSLVITGKKYILSDKKYRIIEVQSKKRSYSMSPREALSFTLKYSYAEYRAVRKERFDLVHHVRPFAFGATFNIVALLGILKNTPFVVGGFCSTYTEDSVDTSGPLSIPKSAIEKLLMFLSIKTLKKANAVIVYDGYTKRQLTKHIAAEKIFTIPPGKDGGKYFFDANKDFSRPHRLLSVGYLIKRKGYDRLLAAFQIISQRFPDATLLIVGDGPEEHNLRRLVRELDLVEKVQFKGAVPNQSIPALYTQADIFVSAQLEESFGQVYIEAMASGLPVVTTKNIGSTQIFSDGSFGSLVEQDDIKDFAMQVCNIIKDPKRAQSMAHAGHREFEKKYDWRVIIEQYLRVYDKVREAL